MCEERRMRNPHICDMTTTRKENSWRHRLSPRVDNVTPNTSHLLQSELVVHLLPHCPRAIIVEICIVSIHENVFEMLLRTPETFFIATVFDLHYANHWCNKALQVELVPEYCAGFARQLLAVVAVWDTINGKKLNINSSPSALLCSKSIEDMTRDRNQCISLLDKIGNWHDCSSIVPGRSLQRFSFHRISLANDLEWSLLWPYALDGCFWPPPWSSRRRSESSL